MAVYQRTQHADIHSLKRPYSAVANKAESNEYFGFLKIPSSPKDCRGRHLMLPLLTPNPNQTSLPIMPFAAGTQAYNSHIPSFLYGCRRNAAQENNKLVDTPNEIAKEDPREEESAECVLKHKHRNSTSTQASESTDSSPTTTISTADSSALTDPSPSSSPGSPVTILPLSSFSSRNFAINTLNDPTMSENNKTLTIPENYDRPMTSPTFPRKPRNAKGLALKLGTQDSMLQTSAPPSPMHFIRPAPISKPRRKPSNLTLQTSSSQFNSGLPMSFEPPPTPSLRPNNIHHSLSMNSLNMFSPDPRAGGPVGGMRLPTFERSHVSGLSNQFRQPPPILEMTPGGSREWREEPSTIRTQLAGRANNDIGGDAFDRPADEDAKSPGYPDGPIVIYDPNVYLYLEPTADEAAKFDVVMNVASEVKNPFEAKLAEEPKSTFDLMDVDKKEEDIPEPMTAASIQTFRTAFEHLPSDNQTPTATSPATPKPPAKQPEYIHIPWEHNTDITTDLMGLCEIIDDRVNKGKKVLIHCQQGASRSASLIIAYGLYRNPSLTVDAAYKAAQARSRYVSPNISLMYSLQDFKKVLQTRNQRNQGRSPAKHRMALSVDEIDFPSNHKEPPQTAPLPQSAHPSRLEDRMGGPGELHSRGSSTPNLREMSPGPSSAPSAFPWPAIDKKLEDTKAAEPVRPTLNTRSISTPTKPTFDFSSHQRMESTSTDQFFTPRNNEFSSPMSIDTPPDSEPSSSTTGPSSQGFAAHREHTAKRKPAPFLNFKPMHPLRSAPPPPPAAEEDIKERVIRLPPPANGPATPALLSPRLLEMAGPAVNNNFGFHAPVQQPTQSSVGFSSMGFSSMGPPPPPRRPAPQRTNSASRADSPPKLAKLDLGSDSIMSPMKDHFKISPFDEVVDHGEKELQAELAKASPNAKLKDILQALKPKKSFIFDRTQLAQAMEKPLPPLPSVPGAWPGSPGMGVQQEELKKVDPRSPPLRGESGIVRSIDDVLEH